MNAIDTLGRFDPVEGDRFIVKHSGETLLDEVFPIKEIPENLINRIDSDFEKITIVPIDDNVVITCYLKF